MRLWERPAGQSMENSYFPLPRGIWLGTRSQLNGSKDMFISII